MSTVLRCAFGPSLLRINIKPGAQAQDYQPLAGERWGDTILSSVTTTARLLLYVSPIVIPWALNRGWASHDGIVWMSKFLAGVGVVVAGAIIMRTFGRLSNPVYTHFTSVLATTQRNYSTANKKLISEYDFQFSSWPVDFDVREETGDVSKPNSYIASRSNRSNIEGPNDILAWLMAHSFGISLVYPGSMSLMKMMLERPLLEGRTKLVQDFNGERSKVVTGDGNEIDTMFVDLRNSKTKEGDKLVICCEGNAGFYEIGIMGTPISCGYSTLGWNHPGFYGSTGRPFPEQETMAADAVMQYAIHKLGFKVENIIVTGWSIGGYTSTWLAMHYPEIAGLLLDATFDDLLPLAIPRMPASLSGLVTTAVSKFINLCVSDQLLQYPGPIRIIRRERDEMICTSDGELWSNRGNNLLLSLLKHRFPLLCSTEALDEVTALLYTPGTLTSFQDSDIEEKLKNINYQFEDKGEFLTENEKRRALCFIATRIMNAINTTHCTPLPAGNFLLPWAPSADIGKDPELESQ